MSEEVSADQTQSSNGGPSGPKPSGPPSGRGGGFRGRGGFLGGRGGPRGAPGRGGFMRGR